MTLDQGERNVMLEARYAPGISSLILTTGLVAIGLNIFLYLHSSSHHLMLWLAGTLAVGIGMRALDRRVKLRIGPEGLFHVRWGKQPIYWSQFEGFKISRHGSIIVVEVRARNPDQFRARLPLSARLDAWINSRLGRAPFFINPTQLEVSAQEILEALEKHLR